MKWTTDQQTIIDHRTGTMLVSAAAGSGKTAVLVQRILNWVVEDRRNIDEFLVVTFTKAAASQMKSKIRKALEKMQEAHPDDEHLIRQLSLIHRANIMTIDSFCKSIFNEHFGKLALDPTMRILDETEGVLLQEDVMEQVLEEAYENLEDAMTVLHGYMNDERSNENIRKLLQSICTRASSFPYPEEWLDAARQDAMAVTEDAIEQSVWMKLLIEDVKTILSEAEEYPERVYKEYTVIGQEVCPKNYQKYTTYFQQECQMIDKVKNARTYRELQEALSDKERAVSRFAWKNTGVPEDHYITELWKNYAEIKKDAKERVKASMETIVRHQQDVSDVLVTLIELSRKFMHAYNLEKQRRNCMDFNDVEHYALQILVDEQEDGSRIPSETAVLLRDSYVEIMIDEYQDSNDLQEAILTSIAKREGQEYSNMFMVGDIKQSIYKFRMARPKLFREKYDTYNPDIEADGVLKKIELKQNFRSRQEVLDAANVIFYQIMNRSLGGIVYDEKVALVPGRPFKELPAEVDFKTEILFVENTGAEESTTENPQSNEEEAADGIESDETTLEEITLEARVIAGKIHELCDSENPMPVWDEKLEAYRGCTYRDIVILLRSGKTITEEYRRVLMDVGIPVYAESGKGYFDSVEVTNILNMLSIVDNSRNDIALAGVLRSPFVGISEEQLAVIRCECRNGSLWDAVLAYISYEHEGDETAERLRGFMARLSVWKEKKTYCTIRELIWDILNETGYYEYVTAMPHGNIRQANIYKLIEKASAYETTSYQGLFDFLRYIERVRIAEQDFGEASVLGSSDNLVQIMTIHKSKGLEFPVVIVGNCGKQFNQMDTRKPVLVDADAYLAVNDKNLEKHYYEKTEKHESIKQHIREENIAEEMRIFYVAMTRAQEKLIMVGSVKSTLAKQEEYQMIRRRAVEMDETIPVKQVHQAMSKLPKIPKGKLLKCNSYLSWLAEGVYYMQNHGIDNHFLEYQIITPDTVDYQVSREIERSYNVARAWRERTDSNTSKTAENIVAARFGYVYPHMAAATRKGKLSVSEIKKMSQVVDEPERPVSKEYFVAMTSDHNAGASYGTLIHLVMEKIAFSSGETLDTVTAAIDHMVEAGIISEEERSTIPDRKVYNMLQSSLGLRMQAAEQRKQLYKEQQFVIGMPMCEVYSETEEQDLELIQGIIDAYFEEDDELVLMDYKTDRAPKDSGAKELSEKYREQLNYYKKTLEQLTGKRVKETYIYSFSLEEVVMVEV